MIKIIARIILIFLLVSGIIFGFMKVGEFLLIPLGILIGIILFFILFLTSMGCFENNN